jgi:membrane protein implicated in regulation of membrane protease activity
MNYEILTWAILLIIFIIIELISVGLTSIWFAAGALVALLLALGGAPIAVQIVAFLVVSVILLAATRPWAQKYINPRTSPTNAESLVGEHIRIAERVSNIDQTGMAVVHGQEWTVRAQDDTEIIDEGQFATVLSISGVKLIVSKMQ